MSELLKSKIEKLIESNNLYEAKKLLTKHKAELGIDYFSMSGIAEILAGNYLMAKEFFLKGLNSAPDNYDLLYNINFLLKNYIDSPSEEKRYYILANLFNINLETENPLTGSENNKKDVCDSNILHGTMEIANQMHTLTKGLSSIGLNAKSLNYYPSYLKYRSDFEIDLITGLGFNVANTISKKLASRFIVENDIFHFHFGTCLTLDCSDLPILNEMGKKIVMQHWGSEVRQYSKAKIFSKDVRVKFKDEETIRHRLDFLSKYIKHCIVSDYELYEYVKDFYEQIYVLPTVVDLSMFKIDEDDEAKDKKEKLLIVHAPTHREAKGSDYVIKAIDELSLVYDFDFKLIENMSYDEAMSTYKKADIVIDQLLVGSYGLLSVENMALGKSVVCYINDYMKGKYPKELPIISADIYDIKSKLEYLITNRDCLHDIGVNSRLYVEKYHNIKTSVNDLIDIYKKL